MGRKGNRFGETLKPGWDLVGVRGLEHVQGLRGKAGTGDKHGPHEYPVGKLRLQRG